MGQVAVYAGLFATAFLAATALPLQSEALLLGLLLGEHFSWWSLIIVASAGNTLGSATNWVLGRFLNGLQDRPWFPAKREAIARAEAWYRRYGRWSLLLSWVPLIGDPLTIAAGALREPFPVFIALVAVAKTGRYSAVAAVAVGWL